MVRKAAATGCNPLRQQEQGSAPWCVHSLALGQLLMAVEPSVSMEASQAR